MILSSKINNNKLMKINFKKTFTIKEESLKASDLPFSGINLKKDWNIDPRKTFTINKAKVEKRTYCP